MESRIEDPTDGLSIEDPTDGPSIEDPSDGPLKGLKLHSSAVQEDPTTGLATRSTFVEIDCGRQETHEDQRSHDGVRRRLSYEPLAVR